MGLIEILAELPYKTIYYLEESSKSLSSRGILPSKMSRQEKVMEDVFKSLLADPDFRVREAALISLIKYELCFNKDMNHLLPITFALFLQNCSKFIFPIVTI